MLTISEVFDVHGNFSMSRRNYEALAEKHKPSDDCRAGKHYNFLGADYLAKVTLGVDPNSIFHRINRLGHAGKEGPYYNEDGEPSARLKWAREEITEWLASVDSLDDESLAVLADNDCVILADRTFRLGLAVAVVERLEAWDSHEKLVTEGEHDDLRCAAWEAAVKMYRHRQAKSGG